MMRKYRHGGENRGGKIRFDFSVNINPLGMPEAAKAALTSGWDIFEDYPDDSCHLLREALGQRFGVESGQIVCGNGAADLIYRLCSCAGFRKVLLPVPSFTEYERALTASGCEAVSFFTEREQGFVPEERHLDLITEEYDGLFLCNPGNPAGGLIGADLMEKIMERCEEKGVTLVVDECFLDFVEDGKRYSAVRGVRADRKIVVMKSFTKIFAMAGLRLGFALFGDRDMAGKVMSSGPPWQVSGPAQAAGLAVLRAGRPAGAESCSAKEESWDDFVDRTVRYVQKERKRMEKGFAECGLSTVKGYGNYILFQGPEGLDAAMAERGVSIRECSDYTGLSNRYYRTAVRTEEENRLLLQEMKRCVKWL